MIKILACPEHLRAAPDTAQFERLACFEKGVYLQGKDDLIFFLNCSAQINPLSIQIRPHDLNMIKSGTRYQSLNFVIDRETRLPDLKLTGKADRLARLLRVAEAIETMAPVTGLNGTETDFNTAYATLRQINVLQEAGRIVGRGLGLTPSGDDILIGMLFVYHALGKDTLIADMGAKLDLSRTNRISADFLRYAMSGYFSERMLALANLKAEEEIPLLLEQILNYGHSSGADSLLGVAYALRESEFR